MLVLNIGVAAFIIAASQPEFIFYEESDESRYYYTLERRTVFETVDFIESNFGASAHLVTITDEFEQVLVNRGLPFGPLFWIGYTDTFQEGNFGWVTGEGSNFEFWASSEPSGDGDFVAIDPASSFRPGEWVNLDGQERIFAVIEEPIPPCNVADLEKPFEILDSVDVMEFLDAVQLGKTSADLDGSGQLDFFDVITYLGVFDAGCS
ncbi:MAG: GC-type dockerin domain-anchored protein [Planctomycetota bacterium]